MAPAHMVHGGIASAGQVVQAALELGKAGFWHNPLHELLGCFQQVSGGLAQGVPYQGPVGQIGGLHTDAGLLEGFAVHPSRVPIAAL